MSQLFSYILSDVLSQELSQVQAKHIQTVTVPGSTPASKRELEIRDVFLGDRRCVICGIPSRDPILLQHFHIIDRLDIKMVCCRYS
jgi:hypothetical protein